MFFSKPTFVGASVLGAAATIAMVSVAPVQAAVLAGSTANIVGTASFNAAIIPPASDTITFDDEEVGVASTGTFAGLIGSSVDVSDVFISLVLAGTPSLYSGTATNPFIDFGGGLTFDVDNPFDVLRFGPTLAVTFPGFTGTFMMGGDIVGRGIFSVNQIGANGSFSMTVSAVPEPLTMLGAGAAVAFGAGFKRKMAQKNNKSGVKS